MNENLGKVEVYNGIFTSSMVLSSGLLAPVKPVLGKGSDHLMFIFQCLVTSFGLQWSTVTPTLLSCRVIWSNFDRCLITISLSPFHCTSLWPWNQPSVNCFLWASWLLISMKQRSQINLSLDVGHSEMVLSYSSFLHSGLCLEPSLFRNFHNVVCVKICTGVSYIHLFCIYLT